ncbi:MAG: TetR/AcrR family transcriptional regulator [Solirubrobacterales bacterium]
MEVKPSRPRGRPSSGAREAVVEAAHDLFLERDYEQVSTGEILARSGVSRGAMYHHFPTKLDLFRAVYEGEQRVLGLVAGELAGATDPFDALILGSKAYLRQAETNPELRRIGPRPKPGGTRLGTLARGGHQPRPRSRARDGHGRDRGGSDLATRPRIRPPTSCSAR